MAWERLHLAAESGKKFTISLPVKLDPSWLNDTVYTIAALIPRQMKTALLSSTTTDELRTRLQGVSPDEIINSVGDEWQTSRGTLPKRIRNWLFKAYKVKMPDEHFESMASSIARYKTGGDVQLDFTKKFDWTGGDFGDKGSCFMPGSSYGNAAGALRGGMERAGYLAIRFYNDEGKGISRAWIKPQTDDYLAVFNAYGYSLPQITKHLVEWLGDEYNYHRAYGNVFNSIYLNSTPYIVGKAEFIKTNGGHLTVRLPED